jgi:hypothetical protein
MESQQHQLPDNATKLDRIKSNLTYIAISSTTHGIPNMFRYFDFNQEIFFSFHIILQAFD